LKIPFDSKMHLITCLTFKLRRYRRAKADVGFLSSFVARP